MGSYLGIDLSTGEFILFSLAGVLTGIINTLAGSGSLITLPIFIFMCGLPADVANGTNRIGAFFQSSIGYASFHRTGHANLQGFGWLLIPGIIGAIIGASLATDLSPKLMNTIIGGLMIFMLGVLLVNPKKWFMESTASAAKNKKPLILFIFFLIGMYAGFIQAGSGIFLMAALVLGAHYSLTASTGLKLIFIFLINIPAIIIFYINGDIHFGFGFLMAIWQTIGALIGVRFATKVPKASFYIHKLLIIIVLISALKFFGIIQLT